MIRLLYPHLYFCTGDLSASDTSLVDLVERHRGPLPPELMPLPSSDRDSPLEWTHLVDVANTFETERNTHYGNNIHPCQHLPVCGVSSGGHQRWYDLEFKTVSVLNLIGRSMVRLIILFHSPAKFCLWRVQPPEQWCLQSPAAPHRAAGSSTVTAGIQVTPSVDKWLPADVECVASRL